MADTTNWTNIISGGLGALGNLYGSSQQAQNLTDAAVAASQSAQFRPVGITTRFGKSGFQYDPATGQLTGAGYQVAPDVAAMREGLMGLAGTGLGQAQAQQAQQAGINQAGQGLFNLGQQYIAQTPQAAAQDWMNKQTNLLAPGREQQLAQLTNQQQQQGRLGLATGGTTAGYTAGGQGLQASNPQMAAYYNAIAQQDAQNAANAQTYGNQQVQFGQGLLSSGLNLQNAGYGLQSAALNPYTNYANQAYNIENQAQNALTQGAGLGSSAAQAAQQAALIQYNAQKAAAEQQNAGIAGLTKSLTSSSLTDPIAKLIAGLAG